ncbi:hypothetical protein [Nocardioides caricicola]|uniref:Uncharacterized protein n=1 Tax=Nocardioides caricicola TaxID=634770 RepID=A0ABW0N4K1_9ACTN
MFGVTGLALRNAADGYRSAATEFGRRSRVASDAWDSATPW